MTLIGFMTSGCAFIEKTNQKNRIAKTINKNNEIWSYCYKKALARDGEDLQGELQLRWRVDYLLGQERVSAVQIESSTIGSEYLARCMKTAVTKIRYELPIKKEQKIYDVSYPFVFKNDKQRAVLRR